VTVVSGDQRASDAEQMSEAWALRSRKSTTPAVAGRTIEHEIVDMNSFDAESVRAG
jgi:hypothetical protein